MRHAILTILLLLFIGPPGYSDGGKVLVTMREIGHEVLLASGDSTSWVSPIEQVDNRTFLIRFQHPFAFTPASLVEIIHRQLLEDHWFLDYLVELNDYGLEVHRFKNEWNSFVSVETDSKPTTSSGLLQNEILIPIRMIFVMI